MYKRPLSAADLPARIPLFPLTGGLLLPYAHRPLNVFEPRYIEMVDNALAGDRLIGVVQPRDATQSAEESPRENVALETVGCVGRLTHWEDNGDGRYFIILEGVCRFALLSELVTDMPYRQAMIDTQRFAQDFDRTRGAANVDRARFIKMMRDYAQFGNFDLDWAEIDKTDTADLINFCCMVSPYGPREKQALLEASSLEDRAETLIALAEIEMARGSGDAVPLN